MQKPQFPVILVAPEHPHNVGFCARAMRANGNLELRIVWNNRSHIAKESWVTAHASAEVLDQARIFSTLQEALADCQSSIAFSRRVFDSVLDHVDLPDLGKSPLLQRPRVALVFGRESKGLNSEELALCSCQCEIPAPGGMSLNLAQAVSVVHYELVRSGLMGAELLKQESTNIESMAKLGDIEALVNFLKTQLTGRAERYPWNESAIRKWLTRLAPDETEVRALFGIFRGLTRSSARSEKSTQSKDKIPERMDI